jgi:subtilisin family serine protease
VIGIFDGGVNLSSDAFSNGNRFISQTCLGDSAEINPCNTQGGKEAQNSCDSMELGCYHGMSVAGFAAGKQKTVTLAGKSVSVGGTAPDASLSYVREAMDKQGTISYNDFVSALNKFVDDVQAHRASAPSVVNLSLSFPRDSYTDCNEDNEAKRAIDTLINAGVVVVAASGNDGNHNRVSYPACMSEVLAVGSTNGLSKISDFSNMSSDIDVVAPGENVWGYLPTNRTFSQVSGTSFSAPIVSGAVALIKQAHPEMSPAQISDLLKSTGDVVVDPANSRTYKQLNLARALAAIDTPRSTTQPSATTARKQPPGTIDQTAAVQAHQQTFIGVRSPVTKEIVQPSNNLGIFYLGAAFMVALLSTILGRLRKAHRLH